MAMGNSQQTPDPPWQLDPVWQYPPDWQYPPSYQYPLSYTLDSNWLIAQDWMFAPDSTILGELLGISPQMAPGASQTASFAAQAQGIQSALDLSQAATQPSVS